MNVVDNQTYENLVIDGCVITIPSSSINLVNGVYEFAYSDSDLLAPGAFPVLDVDGEAKMFMSRRIETCSLEESSISEGQTEQPVIILTCNYLGAKDSGSFTYDLTMYSSQDYYIYIPSFLNTKLEFSDITKVDTFDASIDVGSSVATYEGIDIDAKDLMKFSLVRNLGLRYSVKNLDDFKPECFMYFTNLERLYIGAPNDENVFEKILLPDGVMRSLKDINWGIQKLPANFNELVNCEYFYLMTAPSWQALSSATFTSLAQCKVICTDPYNNDDVQIINRFRQAYNIPGYTTLIPSEVVVHNNNV